MNMHRQGVRHDVDLKITSLRQKLSDSEISPRTIAFLDHMLDEVLSRASKTRYPTPSQFSVDEITSSDQAAALLLLSSSEVPSAPANQEERHDLSGLQMSGKSLSENNVGQSSQVDLEVPLRIDVPDLRLQEIPHEGSKQSKS